MNEAEHLSRSVREWATASGSHIVPAPLDMGDSRAMPSAALSSNEFTALIHAARPSVIYLFERQIDSGEEVATALEEAGIEDEGKAAKAVRRAAERLRAHEGELGRVFAEVVVAGVHHIVYAAAPWIATFEQEVEATAARAAEENIDRTREASAAASAHARGLASRLVADPAFNSGRVSFAKRRFLAGELFPDEDDRVLDMAVELAENMHWLASARQ